MIDIQNTKLVNALYPQLKDNGDFANNKAIDTQGFCHARIVLQIGVLDIAVGSTAETAAPKIEECDTSDGTYADISGAALAAVIADDDDGELKAIDIDLTKTRKRFLRINAPHSGDGTAGANMSAIAILSRPDGNGPVTAADQGLAELVKA